jgi:chorismate mutase
MKRIKGNKVIGMLFCVYKGFVAGYTADVVRSQHVTRNPPLAVMQEVPDNREAGPH